MIKRRWGTGSETESKRERGQCNREERRQGRRNEMLKNTKEQEQRNALLQRSPLSRARIEGTNATQKNSLLTVPLIR